MVVAAGAGSSSSPKLAPVPGIEQFENAGDGIGVHYAVRRMETFRGKNILIAGGGDSAPGLGDQPGPAGQVADPGASPRRSFRAAAHSVNQMRELQKEGKIKFHVASVKAIHGEPGQLKGVTLAGADKNEWHHEADAFLPFFGLTIKLGPIAEFGINLHENLIPVDTARFESADPRHLRHRRHQRLSRQAEVLILSESFPRRRR